MSKKNKKQKTEKTIKLIECPTILEGDGIKLDFDALIAALDNVPDRYFGPSAPDVKDTSRHPDFSQYGTETGRLSTAHPPIGKAPHEERRSSNERKADAIVPPDHVRQSEAYFKIAKDALAEHAKPADFTQEVKLTDEGLRISFRLERDFGVEWLSALLQNTRGDGVAFTIDRNKLGPLVVALTGFLTDYQFDALLRDIGLIERAPDEQKEASKPLPQLNVGAKVTTKGRSDLGAVSSLVVAGKPGKVQVTYPDGAIVHAERADVIPLVQILGNFSESVKTRAKETLDRSFVPGMTVTNHYAQGLSAAVPPPMLGEPKFRIGQRVRVLAKALVHETTGVVRTILHPAYYPAILEHSKYRYDVKLDRGPGNLGYIDEADLAAFETEPKPLNDERFKFKIGERVRLVGENHRSYEIGTVIECRLDRTLSKQGTPRYHVKLDPGSAMSGWDGLFEEELERL